MQVSKIEVSFARPVDLTDGEMYTIHNIVDDACRRTETPELSTRPQEQDASQTGPRRTVRR